MTIRETVKRALINIPGNKPFAPNLIIPSVDGDGLNPYLVEDQTILSTVQICRALRDIPYVKKFDGFGSKGRYIVKGRKVS